MYQEPGLAMPEPALYKEPALVKKSSPVALAEAHPDLLNFKGTTGAAVLKQIVNY